MPLFTEGAFTSAAKLPLTWKIECDALTPADWRCIADVVGPQLDFGEVEGVPKGGLPLAFCLERHAKGSGLLIVDDVLTTGQSMEHHRAGRNAMGLVLFSRRPECHPWITPIWLYSRWLA